MAAATRGKDGRSAAEAVSHAKKARVSSRPSADGRDGQLSGAPLGHGVTVGYKLDTVRGAPAGKHWMPGRRCTPGHDHCAKFA